MEDKALLESGELASPRKFHDAVERLVESKLIPRGNERDAWSVRARVLGRPDTEDPESLFLHFFIHPAKLAHLTAHDERQGGEDMQRELSRQSRQALEDEYAGAFPEKEEPAGPPPIRPLTAKEMDAKMEAARNYDPYKGMNRTGAMSFREFAIGELGEDAREMPHAVAMEKLMDKAKRERWPVNRGEYPDRQ